MCVCACACVCVCVRACVCMCVDTHPRMATAWCAHVYTVLGFCPYLDTAVDGPVRQVLEQGR